MYEMFNRWLALIGFEIGVIAICIFVVTLFILSYQNPKDENK